MVASDGRRQLCAWLAGPPKRSRASLAKLLGVSVTCVYHWVHGLTRPDAEHRKLISLLTNGKVAEQQWLLASELRKFERAQRVVDLDKTGS